MMPIRFPLLCLAFLLPAVTVRAFDQNHSALDRILKQNVRDALVNYTALKAEPKPLNDYLAQLDAVPEKEFASWSEQDRLAFLINLYNASTLKLIVANYPVKSIRNVGWIPGSAWKQDVISMYGKKISLDGLEHGAIRKNYHEARIHFALVCAALGCPPLRDEAYVGARLDGQLSDQAIKFLATTSKNRIDTNAHVLYLSPIFKWYVEDFDAAAGSVLKFITPLLPESTRGNLSSGKYEIDYTEYDWALNDQAKK